LIEKFLAIERSTWEKPGPNSEFRRAVPNVPEAGRCQGPIVSPGVPFGLSGTPPEVETD